MIFLGYHRLVPTPKMYSFFQLMKVKCKDIRVVEFISKDPNSSQYQGHCKGLQEAHQVMLTCSGCLLASCVSPINWRVKFYFWVAQDRKFQVMDEAWGQAQVLYTFKPDRTIAQRRKSRHKVPPLIKKLFAINTYWEREKSVFFNGVEGA